MTVKRTWIQFFLSVILLTTWVSVEASTGLKTINIYVINKRVKLATAMRENALKKFGVYTEYTLNQPSNLEAFQNLLRLVPKKIKIKKRREMIGMYVLVELFFEDGNSVVFGVTRYFGVMYNGYETSIDGHDFFHQYLQPFIPPTFNWHAFAVKDLDLAPRKIKSQYLNFDREFDGYIVRFTDNSKRFIAQKSVRQPYFTKREYSKAFSFLNQTVLIGIDVKTKKIVRLAFFGQEDKHMDRGEMNERLFKKYQKIITDQITINRIDNLYNLQADIIYRMIEFED